MKKKSKPYDESPLIMKILKDGRHYGDGDPRWRQGKNDRPSQTAHEAEVERHRAIKRLESHVRRSPHKAVTELIDRLKDCRPWHRCGSGACPECARAAQRWFVTSISQLIAERGEDD